MKNKLLGNLGTVLFIAGIICDMVKGFIDDKKTERVIEDKINEKFEEREKGS